MIRRLKICLFRTVGALALTAALAGCFEDDAAAKLRKSREWAWDSYQQARATYMKCVNDSQFIGASDCVKQKTAMDVFLREYQVRSGCT